MSKVFFSCWGDTVVDNREKPEAEWTAPEGLKLPFTYEQQDDVRAFIGWDGFFLADASVSIVALCRAYMEAVQAEASCGECYPCRVGTQIAAELLGKLCAGTATTEDLGQLHALLLDVKQASKCQVGQTSPTPVLKALEHFALEFDRCIESGRTIEPVKLLTRVSAPCREACPAHLDIPLYVENIRKRRYAAGSDVARDNCVMPCVLGRVCVRPCEFNCRRANVDEPIQIKYLKRFAADYEMNHGLIPARNRRPKANATGKRVAVIGGGPAGLAAAEKLALAGHDVTIFEALSEGGGMAAVGIPDYRLPRKVLRRDIDYIAALGVQILYNKRLGEEGFTWANLRGMGFDAIFIGIGAHHSNRLGVENEDAGYKGFIHGVNLLRAVALGHEVMQGRKMVVVGGGNVAIDCVRSALRIGYEDVHIVYRRTIKEMPADDVEIKDAQDERIKFNYLCNPTRLIADAEGKLVGVECIRMELGEPDASGRRRPVPMPGSEFVIETDVVVPAIGQQPNFGWLDVEEGFEITRWNTIVADEYTGATPVEGVFAGGDCVTGAATLIQAVAAGNRAAITIDRFLRGEPVHLDSYQRMERLLSTIKTYDANEKVKLPPGLPRQGFTHLPVDYRIKNFEEVEHVMSAQAATTEASRCLRCYRLAGVAL
ncbi:MAG TPA: FAD-dependent oxidoreductase [bacterium]|nr:FAD-dependent oxidoreductase [bacterium]